MRARRAHKRAHTTQNMRLCKKNSRAHIASTRGRYIFCFLPSSTVFERDFCRLKLTLRRSFPF